MKKLHDVLVTSLVVFVLQICIILLVFRALVGSPVNNFEDAENDPVESRDRRSDSSDPDQHVDKIILVVIDALRYDFVQDMKFLKESLDQGESACIFKVNLVGPTVTLPRIKTLVTGTTSSYFDFLRNLKSASTLTDDNVLQRAANLGKKLVFYGDDTWLKLFPQQMFERSEGVSSFFVTDFYEVDSNVTRNVEIETARGFDFDMMILHYLGVDHVGHVHGPFHELIPAKLEEMDSIIRKLYQDMKRKVDHTAIPSVILVTADHGMANVGGHGGDSLPEVTTPLVVLTVGGNKQEKLCFRNDMDWSINGFPMKQVDFAPTLAYLWSLPIPQKSRGRIPLQILSNFPEGVQFQASVSVAKNLVKFVDNKDIRSEALDSLQLYQQQWLEQLPDASKRQELLSLVRKLLTNLEENIADVTSQDLPLLLIGGACLVMTLLYPENSSRNPETLKPGKSIATVFAKVTFIIAWTTLALGSFASFAAALLLLYLGFQAWRNWKPRRLKSTYLPADLFKGVHYGIVLLYFSSSFVEEEHFAAYYLYSSVISLAILYQLFRQKTIGSDVYSLVIVLVIHRFCTSLNSTGQKWNTLPDLNDLLIAANLTPVFFTFALLLLGLLRLRSVIELAVTVGLFAVKFNSEVNFLKFSSNTVSVTVQAIYILLILNVVLKWKKNASYYFLNSLALLCIVLHKMENAILVPLVLLQVRILQVTSSSRHYRITAVLMNAMYMASFFYQGNSNGITSIDVSMGYHGLSSYNEYIVAILTFVGTFSCQILVVGAVASGQSKQLLTSTVLHVDEISLKNFMEVHSYRIFLSNAVYAVVVTVMRQHLFIWSVFVPKLMYQIAFTGLSAVLTLICILLFYRTDKNE